jgi:hypothetical protein
LSKGSAANPEASTAIFPHVGIMPNVRATQDGAMHFVYILECNDGSFYIGHTDEVEARLQVHQSSRGLAHTANRLPPGSCTPKGIRPWPMPSSANVS